MLNPTASKSIAQFHTGVNSGAGYYVPAFLTANPPEAGDKAAQEFADAGSPNTPLNKRLQKRMVLRSGKFNDNHQHRTGYLPNPFIVKILDPVHSSVRESEQGYDFVVMKKGVAINVELNDREGEGFRFFRRSLTPHLLQGDASISISNYEPEFSSKRLTFTIMAREVGLVCIAALDYRGRCRGELVISVKDFTRRYSVQFVRLHNGIVTDGSEKGKLQHASAIEASQLNKMLRDANKLLFSQTGLGFQLSEPLIDTETDLDLSNGITDTDYKEEFANRREGTVDFTVYLFKKFKLPFNKSFKIVAAATLGKFVTNNFGVVAIRDEMFDKGEPHVNFAHELCHSLIDQNEFVEGGYDAEGHYKDKGRGLMRGDQNSEDLRWRDLNLINSTGLDPGGLAALKKNHRLWENSGS